MVPYRSEIHQVGRGKVMRSISKTSVSWTAICIAMVLTNTSCSDLLGPDEETVKRAEQAACVPLGRCGTCTESGSGGSTSTSQGFAPRTVRCHVKTGDCDRDTYCTGDSYDCPNPYEPSSTRCHAKTGDCDRDTYCTGSSATCPGFYEPSSKVCHSSVGLCDRTVNCTGSSAICPASFEPSSKICHTAGDLCDKTVNCTGASAACPSWFKTNGTICQAASCADGVLHSSSTCDGTNAQCPAKPVVSCPSGGCDAAGLSCTEYLVGAAGSAGAGGSAATAGSAGSGTSLANTTPSSNSGGGGDSSALGGQSGSGAADSTSSIGQGGNGTTGACLKDEDCPQYTPFCVSGVCCNKACKGQCEACNLEGLVGICSPLPKDRQPISVSCDGLGTSSAGAASTTTSTTGSGATAGATIGTSSTAHHQQAGRSNSNDPTGEDSGCGCHIPGAPPSDANRLWLLLAGAMAVVSRPRSRKRQQSTKDD